MDLRVAAKLLSELPRKAGRRAAVQIGQGFVVGAEDITTPDGEPLRLPGARPPLATLIGNEVALKCYLTLVLMTKTPPHALYHPRMYAELAETLGYELLQPPNYYTGPGTARVRRAVTHLQDLGLLKMMTAGPGEYSVVVCHMPGAETPPFITLPTGLWSNAWILAMKPPALAAYFHLRLAGARDGRPVAIDRHDRDRSDLSDDTLLRGMKQLRQLGIVDWRRALIQDRYGRRRVSRKAYLVDDDRVAKEQASDACTTDWDQLWAAATQ